MVEVPFYVWALTCCLVVWQIGATFLPAVTGDELDIHVTRVPAGMSAYCATTAYQGSSTSGIGDLKGLRADGTAVSDFRLASATGATVFELAELLMKPARFGSPASKASFKSEAHHSMQYTVRYN